MEYHNLHSWEIPLKEAASLQQSLRTQLCLQPLKQARFLAGADISYNRFSNLAYGAFVVWDLEKSSVVEEVTSSGHMRFPYVPGFLSFREIPTLLLAWEKLQIKPDLIFVDGHGIAHPRRMGIAAHLGLFLQVPTLGCAKTRLYGECLEPEREVGAFTYIRDKEETLGIALRTKSRAKPMFISPGHLVDLETAKHFVLAALRGYRLPEPTRLAHLLANKARLAGVKH